MKNVLYSSKAWCSSTPSFLSIDVLGVIKQKGLNLLTQLRPFLKVRCIEKKRASVKLLTICVYIGFLLADSINLIAYRCNVIIQNSQAECPNSMMALDAVGLFIKGSDTLRKSRNPIHSKNFDRILIEALQLR